MRSGNVTLKTYWSFGGIYPRITRRGSEGRNDGVFSNRQRLEWV